jgi:SAM-dependent MidA family methyltransferase
MSAAQDHPQTGDRAKDGNHHYQSHSEEQAQANRISAALLAALTEAGNASNGFLPFSEFMQTVLYAPGLGYYSGPQTKFGVGGDFTTAAEHSSLYAACIARQVAEVLQRFGGNAEILEFGAGSGRFAADLLHALEQAGSRPKRYTIIDLSAELIAEQRQALSKYTEQGITQWNDALPAPGFVGVVIANEVLDAMPVVRFRKIGEGQFEEIGVGVESGALLWRTRAVDDELCRRIRALEDSLGQPMTSGYVSEINLLLSPWIASLADFVQAGLILLCDYGYTRRDYYHPERNNGTLLCHFRHAVNYEPFVNIGAQDISASVDFTAVAEAAVQHDLDVAGFANQAQFLISCGLDRILGDIQTDSPDDYLAFAAQAKTLTLPGEMGERFKVMALTRQIDAPLLGFKLRDMRGRL